MGNPGGRAGALSRRGEVALAAATSSSSGNELASTVSVLAFDGHRDPAGAAERADAPGALFRHVQTASTLPPEWRGGQTQRAGVWKAASHCSEVCVLACRFALC